MRGSYEGSARRSDQALPGALRETGQGKRTPYESNESTMDDRGGGVRGRPHRLQRSRCDRLPEPVVDVARVRSGGEHERPHRLRTVGPDDRGVQLFTVKPDGTGVLDLQVDTDVLAWSPDGSKLLITDLISGPGPLRPATINPDGSGLKRLDGTLDPLLDLGCHAHRRDGARIACQGFNDDHPELAGLYTLRASDGGDLVRVTS